MSDSENNYRPAYFSGGHIGCPDSIEFLKPWDKANSQFSHDWRVCPACNEVDSYYAREAHPDGEYPGRNDDMDVYFSHFEGEPTPEQEQEADFQIKLGNQFDYEADCYDYFGKTLLELVKTRMSEDTRFTARLEAAVSEAREAREAADSPSVSNSA